MLPPRRTRIFECRPYSRQPSMSTDASKFAGSPITRAWLGCERSTFIITCGITLFLAVPRLSASGPSLFRKQTVYPLITANHISVPNSSSASLLFSPLFILFWFGRLVRKLSKPVMSLRYAASSVRNSSAASKQRLSQVQRHFSATTSARREIQDAYILSASRTPTAKVTAYYTPLDFRN